MGYPKDILETRAVIRHGDYAVIPPTGLVNNVVPGIEKSTVSIVASPKLGASFAQYVLFVQPGGGTSRPFAAEEGVEGFVYCVAGQGVAGTGGEEFALAAGCYVYAPPGAGLTFANTGGEPLHLVLYTQRHIPLAGHAPRTVFGDVGKMPFRIYDDMENVFIKDLLPTDDLGFDMNFHILSFKPGGCHPFIETHVQEHGAYILSGEGAYYLGGEWRMIKKGDFVWFGPYTTQGAYGVGREDFTYVYSKDCNRDVPV